MKNVFRALQFFRPDASRMAMVFLLLLFSIGLNVLKPWPLALIVDCVLGSKPLPGWFSRWDGEEKGQLLAVFSMAVLLIHAAQGALSALTNYLSIRVGLGGLRRVRNEVFQWLQRLSLRFHHGSKAGDLIFRAAWDTFSFQTLFQQGLVTFVTALVSLLLMVIVMAQLSGILTLVALGTVPLLMIVIKFFGRKMSQQSAVAQQADSQVTSLVQQSIVALPLTQSYTREEDEAKRFATQTAQAQEERLAQHGWELLYWLGISLAFGIGTTGIVWLGAKEVQSNSLTVGQLLIFLAYLTQLYDPLNQLSHVGATISGATAGTRRVFEILDTPEEVKDAVNARPIVVRGNLTFENVSFAYEKDREVLRQITFSLKAGESAALIGPSGAGKTTLMNMVPRFFDPANGVIKLEGIDLRELRLKELRAQIALVLQEPIILPTSVAENIAYGKPDATAAEIEAAARAANADGFIRKLARQYETIIGEGAGHLSVGEKQRINLARAFLKDAPILLLDEPTSALDGESETLVVASLLELMRGRTTVMIAHRLTTIRRVSKILVLQEGRLAEMGSHEELLQKGGYYGRVASGQVALD